TLMMATYTPGPGDISDGSVELCITGVPCDPCTISPTECFTLHIALLPVADAGEDATICADEIAQLMGFVDNACGFYWETTGDGIFNDNQLLDATYTPGPEDVATGSTELCLTAEPCDPCTLAATDCVTLTVMEVQGIQINTGWQGISSNIVPIDTDIETVLAGIMDQLVIIYNLNNEIFYPAYNVNTMYNWNNHSGYFIKVNDGIALNICGTDVVDKTLQLLEGWNVIPVLSGFDVAVTDVFDAVSDQLIIIKEIAGPNMYYPLYGISSLNVLERSNAYLVKVSADCSISYPDVLTKTSAVNLGSEHAGRNPWNLLTVTPASHVVIVLKDALPVLENGDIIGAFNSEDLCVGSVTYENSDSDLPVMIYGDDFTSEETDGMLEQELISYKLFRNGETLDIEVEYDQTIPQHDGLFATNGLSGINYMKLGATGIHDASSDYFSVYPNPTDGKVTIGALGDFDLEVTDARGRVVYTGEIEGNHKLNLEDQPNGIYFIKLTNDATTLIKKVVKQ
nr:T9SS type A sorting domain-containing protein [Bacteroidota bacterium]